MPAPVRQVVTSRWIATLIVIVVPILVVSGILSISWNGYQPSFNIDQKRAVQVERDVEQQATRAAQELKALQDSRRR
jgi:ABC-type Na+ efflux pump permease subunit